MKTKRIFGYIFIVLAVLFSLLLLSILPNLGETIKGLIKLISGRMSNYQSGYFIGSLTAQLTIIGLTIFFWIFGLKWIKLEDSKNNK